MLIVDWLLLYDSTVFIKEKPLKMKITTELGYSLLRKVFKCEELNCEQEELLFDEVFKRSITDTIIRIKTECQYSKPDPDLKHQIWSLLTDPAKATKLSLYDYAMLARVFF